MAELLGAGIAQWIVTIILIKVLSKWNSSVPGILTANALALFIGTVIGGFGRADGAAPKFAESFAISVIPQLVVFGILMWRWNRAQVPATEPALAGVPSIPVPDTAAPAAPRQSWPKRALYTVVYLVAFGVAWIAAREGFRYLRTPTQAQLEEASRQGLLIARDDWKKKLPQKLDDAITLVDVRVTGLNMACIHEVGTGYEITDLDAV